MMKIKYMYKIAFCLWGLVLFGSSCKKELDLNPLSNYSSQTFWNTESDVILVLSGIYAKMQTTTEGLVGAQNSLDAISDDAYWKPINGLTTEWTTEELGQQTPSSGGLGGNAYGYYYGVIAQCNYFLANVTRVSLPAASLAAYQGEVRAIRAYCYFQLSQIYGGVIITLVPESATETHPAKSTKAQVLTQVYADLDFAIANLTNTTLGSTTAGFTGRLIKGTAQGLEAKVYLWNGDYVNAARVAGNLINDPTNPFSLYSDYKGLFNKTGQRVASNHEIMFSVRYQLPNLTNGFDLRNGYPASYTALQPISNLIASYQCTDGQPTSTSPLYNAATPYANRDPRMRYTSYVPGDLWPPGGPGVIFNGTNAPCVTGFLLRKGLDETRAPFSNATLSDQDIVLLRYADVLLIYAEAQNEATAPDASVYSVVNAVRARPGVAMPALPAGLTQATMRTAIRNERRWEFALEGMRYWDLIRWKTAASVLPTITNPGGNQRAFNDPKNYLFPFPQSEVDREGNLQQNPNY
jgi:hypothetical protein